MTNREHADAMDRHQKTMNLIADRLGNAGENTSMIMKRYKKTLVIQCIVLAGILAYVFFIHKPSGSDDEAIVPYKQHIEIMNNEIKKLRDQQKADSLDRLQIIESIDQLIADRKRIDQTIAEAKQTIKNVKKEYEKINSRYNNASDDSLSRLFAERFGN